MARAFQPVKDVPPIANHGLESPCYLNRPADSRSRRQKKLAGSWRHFARNSALGVILP
jgi:hypothetical protein